VWEVARKGIPRLTSDNHFKNPKKVLNILNKSVNSKHDPNWTSNIPLERSWRLNIECELTFSICSNFELGILAKIQLKIKPTIWLLTTKPWGPLMKVCKWCWKSIIKAYNFVLWSFLIKTHTRKVWTNLVLVANHKIYYRKEGDGLIPNLGRESDEFKASPWPKVSFICVNHSHCLTYVVD
jgi:hypothetical protein